MQDELRALVRLAEIDASARHLEEQLTGIPAELDERRQAVKGLEALVGAQRAQMGEAEKLLAAQEDELKLRADMLVRSKTKSAKAKNLREADAAERELDAVRRTIKDAEVEKERLEGVISSTRNVLEGPLAELEAQKSALAEAEKESAEKLAALRAELEIAVAGRSDHAVKVPKPVYRRYERIRPKIHPAVVEAVNGVCTGCRMAIAPQLYNQIIRGDDFYQCQACQRFLYHKEAIL